MPTRDPELDALEELMQEDAAGTPSAKPQAYKPSGNPELDALEEMLAEKPAEGPPSLWQRVKDTGSDVIDYLQEISGKPAEAIQSMPLGGASEAERRLLLGAYGAVNPFAASKVAELKAQPTAVKGEEELIESLGPTGAAALATVSEFGAGAKIPIAVGQKVLSLFRGAPLAMRAVLGAATGVGELSLMQGAGAPRGERAEAIKRTFKPETPLEGLMTGSAALLGGAGGAQMGLRRPQPAMAPETPTTPGGSPIPEPPPNSPAHQEIQAHIYEPEVLPREKAEPYVGPSKQAQTVDVSARRETVPLLEGKKELSLARVDKPIASGKTVFDKAAAYWRKSSATPDLTTATPHIEALQEVVRKTIPDQLMNVTRDMLKLSEDFTPTGQIKKVELDIAYADLARELHKHQGLYREMRDATGYTPPVFRPEQLMFDVEAESTQRMRAPVDPDSTQKILPPDILTEVKDLPELGRMIQEEVPGVPRKKGIVPSLQAIQRGLEADRQVNSWASMKEVADRAVQYIQREYPPARKFVHKFNVIPFEHPALQELIKKNNFSDAWGYFDPNDKSVNVVYDPLSEPHLGKSSFMNRVAIGLHETAHAVQKLPGKSPLLFKGPYRDQPGEIKARFAEKVALRRGGQYEQALENMPTRLSEALEQEPTQAAIPAEILRAMEDFGPAPEVTPAPSGDEITAWMASKDIALAAPPPNQPPGPGGKSPLMLPQQGSPAKALAEGWTSQAAQEVRLPKDPSWFNKKWKGLIHPIYRIPMEYSSYLRELDAVKRLQSLDMERYVRDFLKLPSAKDPNARRLFARAATGDNTALAQLSPELIQHTNKLMNAVMARETKLMEQGQLSPSTVARHLQQTKHYLRRMYMSRLFPDWQPPDASQAEVVEFIDRAAQSAGTTMSRSEIISELSSILSGGRQEHPLTSWKSSRLRKDIFKRKKEIPAPIRKFLGEVDDGAFLAGITLAQQDYNIRQFNLFKEIAMQPQMSAPVPAPHLHPLALPPDRKAFGDLAGKYVRHELREMLVDMQNQPDPWNPSIWSSLVSWHKFAKIPLSAPASAVRNFMGNVLSGELVGLSPLTNPVRWGVYMKRAADALWNYHIREQPVEVIHQAVEDGAMFTEIGNVEIKKGLQSLRQTLDMVPIETDPGKFVYEFYKRSNKAKDAVSTMYDTGDQVWKVAAYMYLRDKAAKHALKDPVVAQMGERRWASAKLNESFTNYATQGDLLNKVRRTGVFNPVLSFRADMLRIYGTTILRGKQDPGRLFRLALFMGKIAAAGALLKVWSGMTPEELEQAEAALPASKVRNAPISTIWPMLDGKGRRSFADFTPFVPLGDMLSGDPELAWYDNVMRNALAMPLDNGPLHTAWQQVLKPAGLNQPEIPGRELPKEFANVWTGLRAAYDMFSPGVVDQLREVGRTTLDNPQQVMLPGGIPAFGARGPFEEQLTPGQGAMRLLGGPRPIPVGPLSLQQAQREQVMKLLQLRSQMRGAARGPEVQRFPGNVQMTREQILEALRQELDKRRNIEEGDKTAPAVPPRRR